MVDYDWFAFCQALGLWELRSHRRNKKANALSKARASKNVGKAYYDPTREIGIKGKNETRSALWDRAPLQSKIRFEVQSPEVRGRSVLKVPAQALGELCVLHWPLLASVEAWERSRSGRAFWPYLDAVDKVCLRTVSMESNVPEPYWPVKP